MLVRTPEENTLLGTPRSKREDDIIMGTKEIRGMMWAGMRESGGEFLE
jgi:hypothetical protein